MIKVAIMVEDFRRLEKVANERGVSVKEMISFLCEKGFKTEAKNFGQEVLKPKQERCHD